MGRSKAKKRKQADGAPAMNKRAKRHGDADKWDDSLLVAAWDAAQAEYDEFHSLAAGDVDVEALLDRVERLEEQGLEWDAAEVDGGPAGGRDGEWEIEETGQGGGVSEGVGEQAMPSMPVPGPLPGVNGLGVQDEGLKNLMMSWYWAGYYTGLHEGQAGAAAAAVKVDVGTRQAESASAVQTNGVTDEEALQALRDEAEEKG